MNMNETINLVQESLSAKQQTIRRLLDDQDKLLAVLSDNFTQRVGLTNAIMRQESELKDLYELHYNTKASNDCCTASKMSGDEPMKTYDGNVKAQHTFRPSY